MGNSLKACPLVGPVASIVMLYILVKRIDPIRWEILMFRD